jgi:protein-S-isoprenylcysteine O-methyltransferase Ste14
MLHHEDIEPWDRILAPLVGLGGASVLLVAGLDARFHWSSGFAASIKVIAAITLTASFALGSWALIHNRFFSGVVRIQSDRGHHVVSTGPYAWIRHPGYAGGLVSYLAVPFLLDSVWAIVPAALFAATLVVRTSLEDKTLQARLAGYAEYSQRVRYRLFPGVW